MTKVCLNCGRRNSNTQLRYKTCGTSLVQAVIVRDSPLGRTWLLLVFVGLLLLGIAVAWYLPYSEERLGKWRTTVYARF